MWYIIPTAAVMTCEKQNVISSHCKLSYSQCWICCIWQTNPAFSNSRSDDGWLIFWGNIICSLLTVKARQWISVSYIWSYFNDQHYLNCRSEWRADMFLDWFDIDLTSMCCGHAMFSGLFWHFMNTNPPLASDKF